MNYIVIETADGILLNVTSHESRREALEVGKAAWGGKPLGDGAEGEAIDPAWGGVARTYVMHWFDDEDDVWVVEPNTL